MAERPVVRLSSGEADLCPGLGAALVLAVLSTACYAVSAVLQQREAARGVGGGMALLTGLARRPWWWVAVAATVTAAGLHVAALALGPLSAIQPVGALTLVLALPLGVRLGGREVSRAEWRAAAAVVVGLTAVLVAAPHRAPSSHPSTAAVLWAAGAVAVLVVLLTGAASRLPARAVPVARAAGAATCFGFASAMARTAAIAPARMLIAAALAATGATVGLGLAQLAYRNGGLGAPLATQNLVDPLVAVLAGATLLGEPLPLDPARIAVGVIGVVATAAGIRVLARPRRRETAPGAEVTPARESPHSTSRLSDEERSTDGVVR